MSMKFKIGTDPEMFLKVGKEFVPACGLFPGTKDEPFELEKGAVQVDGLALEFNIHPAETVEEFDRNITTVLTQIDEMIKKVNPEMRRVFIPFARFDSEVFEDLEDNQKILGCDPDYNGHTGLINPRPEIQDEPFRTAAGHIHIGWTEGEDVADPSHFEDCRYVSERIGRSYAFGPDSGSEFERLKYYGANYAFRPKPYGVEIRFPSNIWLETKYSRIDAFNSVMRQMKAMAA